MGVAPPEADQIWTRPSLEAVASASPPGAKARSLMGAPTAIRMTPSTGSVPVYTNTFLPSSAVYRRDRQPKRGEGGKVACKT